MFIIIIPIKVPTEKEIEKRLKCFYVNRRSTLLISNDEEKTRKRKHAMKASKMTFVSKVILLLAGISYRVIIMQDARQKAVEKAIDEGRVRSEEEIISIRKVYLV